MDGQRRMRLTRVTAALALVCGSIDAQLDVHSLPLIALEANAPTCDENVLKIQAFTTLYRNVDPDFGAVGQGNSSTAGFQYLKTADALLAAQAIAHIDFTLAAAQFRHILVQQRGNGQLPLLVYGPTVDAKLKWIDSKETFYPGPAFWPSEDLTMGGLEAGESSDETELAIKRYPASSVIAPPIAADVAWQLYRLSPYEAAMGVAGHTADAVKFLCDVYEPLKRLHDNLLAARSSHNNTNATMSLLASHHPWETFSAFSSHWKTPLAALKHMDGYDTFVSEIPASAKTRFAAGATLIPSEADPIKDYLEPLVFLAHCQQNSSALSVWSANPPCPFAVHDVEFNSLVLRSTDALASITEVLLERSSICSDFRLEREDLFDNLRELIAQADGLRDAIVGSDHVKGLWNDTTELFDDADQSSPDMIPSLRDALPAYTIDLSETHKLGVLSHFLSSTSTSHFFCSQFPAQFLPCRQSDQSSPSVVLTHYNSFLQRAFVKNELPGLATYLRNMTRNLVCSSINSTDPVPASGVVISTAYNATTGAALPVFEDGYAESSLAAALLLNILLPAVMIPPSPDTPPIDHRMLTVIMCVELVVAFGVALGCVFFSVYFVANRPREKRSRSDASRDRRKRETTTRVSQPDSQDSQDIDFSSSAGSSYDLEEGLLSDEEDAAYGSFERERMDHESSGTWKAVTDALASISPW
ncbi:hypothetical protein Poli38472_003374 [Pythium oligandrum]|uniref:Mannosylglycerate hydrolase MGH1-like glycoside hydrolase domain-containing protein n=1 Tax=Pythium oligandrum TaxID=41045 RepID=A0A8K1FE03_PYTOL|nr:hypothetical protein Poli38472_003374 [Pythium oligandrum]|eukprot:TMW57449.1 hypothetical protein Poli38472_003374 [Pythium oligandrum]